jgi:hypothetical protein
MQAEDRVSEPEQCRKSLTSVKFEVRIKTCGYRSIEAQRAICAKIIKEGGLCAPYHPPEQNL